MADADRSDSKRRAEAEETRVGWRMAGIGMQVTSEVVAGLILGWLFDLWRGSGNIGVIVGASAGILVALWTLIHSTLKLNRMLDRTAPTTGRGKPLPYKERDETDSDGDDTDYSSEDDDWNTPKYGE